MRLAVDVAATHRLVRLVTEDEITRPLREAIDTRWPDSKLNYLMSCQACVSVWAGAAVAVLPAPARWTLALSAGTMLLGWAAELAGAVVSGGHDGP